MSLQKPQWFKAGFIYIIHKFSSLQKQNRMAENESRQRAQGGQRGSRSGSLGGSKGGPQQQDSTTSRKSTGKEDERGEPSSGRGGSNK